MTAKWEQVWEQEKEMVGRAAHEAWLSWIAEASPLGHLPQRDEHGCLRDEMRDIPPEYHETLGTQWRVWACLECGEDASRHIPKGGAQRVAYEDPFCQAWEHLDADQRETIVDAVGGRERFRLGYLAASNRARRTPQPQAAAGEPS